MARYIGSIIPVLVACLAIAYFVLRSDQPTSSNGNRIDPRTGIQFPVQASFSVGKNLALAGVGTRTKASVVKVYSVGEFKDEHQNLPPVSACCPSFLKFEQVFTALKRRWVQSKDQPT
mmetsp:Transcript_49648/g.84951  ORF Transcript_49648/g.84951 Transcript_49648/m.84951 type:complete len:118 (-) Transcript_49648:395-748(-)